MSAKKCRWRATERAQRRIASRQPERLTPVDNAAAWRCTRKTPRISPDIVSSRVNVEWRQPRARHGASPSYVSNAAQQALQYSRPPHAGRMRRWNAGGAGAQQP